MRIAAATAVLTLATLAAWPARAGDPKLVPLPRTEAVSTHGPYEAGACDTCHERADAADPGKPLKVSNDLCFECHDEFRAGAVKMEKRMHPTAKAACTVCHSPHNSRKRKLLL